MANVVTRDDLARQLQEWVETQGDGALPMNAARDEVTWFFDTISQALVQGDEVRIHGFGIFRIQERAARTGHNPFTMESVKVPARRYVRFRPSTTLSAELKGGSGRRATAARGKSSTATKSSAKSGAKKKR